MSESPPPADARAERQSRTSFDQLPDELLVQIFGHLAVVCGRWEEDDPLRLHALPYRQAEDELVPCTGLRGYPFLAQVCRKWNRLLASPMAQALVWRRVCVDLGHELITSIHTPLRWTNTRPSPAEYAARFAATTISAAKVLRFLSSVSPHVTSWCVSHSEAYESEDGEAVGLADKHNFGAGHLGYGLALLAPRLQELRLYRCNDLVSADGGGIWSLAAQLPELRVLQVEGLRGPLPSSQAAGLGELRKLEVLAITGDPYRGSWAVGLDALPAAWSRLTGLTRLELRSHPQLAELPAWLPSSLRGLRALDVSGCEGLALEPLTALTGLHVLVLQHLRMAHAPPGPAELAAAAAAGVPPPRSALPDLRPLAPSLRSLSVACNRLTALPDWLSRLSRLQHLDLSNNKDLQVASPLNGLAQLPHLQLLDFRRVHVMQEKTYWDEAKCVTMQHLSRLAKALKRRCPPPRMLSDL